MMSREAPTAPSDPNVEIDRHVAAFEAAYARDGAAEPADFAPIPDHPLYAEVVCELVRVDLEFAWDRGDEWRVERYRSRFPELFRKPDLLRAVLGEEQRLRTAAGEVTDEDEFDRRFGSKAAAPLPDTRVIPPIVDGTRHPEPGDVIAGFRVVAELGSGAFGRVYLCQQADLADRFVAVKLSSKFPGESQTLARLQHANIVPVYSVHRHGPFHAVCMPYLGSMTLADLFHEFHTAGRLPNSAAEVASTLIDRGGRTATASGLAGPASDRLVLPVMSAPPGVAAQYERLSYVELVLWLGAELADGLAHAHERGVLHRDIKPANVLLTDEGRPMLLDFNLSADATESGVAQAFVGGTIRYMAPEQLAAMIDREGHPDARADVYSLGLVLYELLTDRLPHEMPTGSPDEVLPRLRDARRTESRNARTLRGDLSPAVASILRTALAPEPARRYQATADLRDDLRRQLNHEVLKVAPDRSPGERLRKWARRHPRLSSWVTVSLIAVALAVFVGSVVFARIDRLERAAAKNKLHELGGALDRLRGLLADRSGPLAEIDAASELSRAALHDIPHPTSPAWNSNSLISQLNPDERVQFKNRVGELNYFKARAEGIRAARSPDRAVRKAHLGEAVHAHDLAWDCYPGSALPVELIAQRAWLWHQTGREVEARELVKRLGLPIEETDPRGMAKQLLPVLIAAAKNESSRAGYWLHLGRVALTAGDVPMARVTLRTAGELEPESPWPHFHAGTAALAAKDFTDAEERFARCLAIEDAIPEAYLNRAIARVRLRNYAGAIDDLNRIEPHEKQLPRLFFVRELARRLSGDVKGADRDRAAGLRLTPTDAAGWSARGEARLSLVPPDVKGAVADFEQAIETDPDVPQGYQNLANALSESQGKFDEAVKVLDRAVERFPDYTPARAGRGVLLARLGRRDAARRDADATVERDPSGIVCYQAGCVYLLTAVDQTDHARAIALLRQALRLEPTWAKEMPTDPDLKAVHGSPEFRKLVAAALELSR